MHTLSRSPDPAVREQQLVEDRRQEKWERKRRKALERELERIEIDARRQQAAIEQDRKWESDWHNNSEHWYLTRVLGALLFLAVTFLPGYRQALTPTLLLAPLAPVAVHYAVTSLKRRRLAGGREPVPAGSRVKWVLACTPVYAAYQAMLLPFLRPRGVSDWVVFGAVVYLLGWLALLFVRSVFDQDPHERTTPLPEYLLLSSRRKQAEWEGLSARASGGRERLPNKPLPTPAPSPAEHAFVAELGRTEDLQRGATAGQRADLLAAAREAVTRQRIERARTVAQQLFGPLADDATVTTIGQWNDKPWYEALHDEDDEDDHEQRTFDELLDRLLADDPDQYSLQYLPAGPHPRVDVADSAGNLLSVLLVRGLAAHVMGPCVGCGRPVPSKTAVLSLQQLAVEARKSFTHPGACGLSRHF